MSDSGGIRGWLLGSEGLLRRPQMLAVTAFLAAITALVVLAAGLVTNPRSPPTVAGSSRGSAATSDASSTGSPGSSSVQPVVGPPLRLSARMLPVVSPDAPADLVAYLRGIDPVLAVMDPALSYLGFLADRAMRGEVAAVRVMVEGGAAADVMKDSLATLNDLRPPPELDEHRRLLRMILRAGSTAQQLLLEDCSSPQGENANLCAGSRHQAMMLYLDLLRAFEAAVDGRNAMAERPPAGGAHPAGPG